MQSSSPPKIITTVTLNPAIDEAVAVDQFLVGEKNRCKLENLDPGGKGINASRVIRRLGGNTIALGFVGGVTGQLLRSRLDEEHVMHAFDHVDEATRINVMIYERTLGRRTRMYLDGPHVPPEKLAALRTRLAQIPAQSIVVFGGSLPPGLSSSVYAELVSELRPRGVRAIVDTSGPALEAVLSSHPLLIKPNVEEAEEILGRRLRDDASVLAAARELQARGAENVVISQAEDGAIAVGPAGAWKAYAPRVMASSTVGAGDSMVAGLALAFNDGLGLVEGLRLGAAAGAATVMVGGTQLCRAADVDRLKGQVRIEPLPLAA